MCGENSAFSKYLIDQNIIVSNPENSGNTMREDFRTSAEDQTANTNACKNFGTPKCTGKCGLAAAMQQGQK